MDDEFALCWNNFQENIASGFQSLFDRGDLVDVTLACDGKLLQAHKIVLAICSPYFQEMFVSNPCRHPIIILKDVSYAVMSELLQFMYQGVVNVKHAELSSFMKIAQALQIKGLATSSGQQQNQRSSPSPQLNATASQTTNSKNVPTSSNTTENYSVNLIETKINTALYSSVNPSTSSVSGGGQKRSSDYLNSPVGDHISGYPKKHLKRTSENNDHDISGESMENLSSDDVFLPTVPQISMVESNRFDLGNVKRETNDLVASPGGARNHLPPQFNFEYNGAYSKNVEYPNELHMNNDLMKAATSNCGINGANHGDVQSGGNITMLSSTSLLHGNCIFNRNNTVATQQGMKTYWLCKSYRITMCRARCITHQGRVISATGVHNHQPHMKGPHMYPNNDFPIPSSVSSGNNANINNSHPTMRLPLPPPTIPTSQSSGLSHGISHLASSQQHQQHQIIQQNQTDSGADHAQQNVHHSPSHSHHGHQEHQTPTGSSSGNAHSQPPSNNSISLQNMMQSVLSPNNILHQSHISQLLSPIHHHHHSHGTHGGHGGSHGSPHMNSSHQPPSSLQITPIISSSQGLHSPDSPRTSAHGHHLQAQQQHPHSHSQHQHQHQHQHPNQTHIHQQESPSLQQQHRHQSLAGSTAINNNSSSVVAASSSITSANSGSSSISPLSPQTARQQQQHCDSISPEGETHSMTSEPNIMSAISMAQPSFKMEQI